MRRSHITVVLVALAIIAAAFGVTEVAQALEGYPFTG